MLLASNRALTSQRRGFTLVELLVAAALAVTIMWILAESFKMGIDFARSARSTGEMMTQLNNAGQIIVRDLEQPHFLPSSSSSSGSNNNGLLSLCRLDQLGTASGSSLANATGYTPPSGYFEFSTPLPQPNTPITDDVRGEGFMTNTVTGVPNATGAPFPFLRFTMYLPQGLPQNLFSTTSPINQKLYFSRAAEVCYFLEAQQAGTGQTPMTVPVIDTQQQIGQIQNPPGSGPQQLYTLYRRQRLVAVTSDYSNNFTQAFQTDPNAADVISITNFHGTLNVNTLTNFGSAFTDTVNTPPKLRPVPATRIPLTPFTAASGRQGDDILLSNVLSFEIQAIWAPNPILLQPGKNPAPVPSGRPYTVAQKNPTYNPPKKTPWNSYYPFDFLPQVAFNPNPATGQPNSFDTWYKITENNGLNWNNFAAAPNNRNLLPMPVRVTALQITLRIYDPRTMQTRQNTWRIAM
jgi:prepilin-type N-terminal cleavage/methylation domain-containing protein